MRYKDYVMSSEASLFEVMAVLEKLKCKIVYITDDENALLGSITDGDVRRYALAYHTFEAKASEVMKSPCIYAKSVADAALKTKQLKIGSVPVVNEKMEIIDLWLDDGEHFIKTIDEKYQNTPVVMMAGGKGERLYPFTAVLPKPLIPIQGVPIAQRIMDRFVSVGLRKFLLSLNYKKNIIKAYFDDVMEDIEIQYYEEERPTGTAGSLRAMQQDLTQDFFLINCDNLILVDLEDLLRYHQENNNMITVVSALKSMTIPYGVLDLNVDGRVFQMREKPMFNQFINTGMYVVNPAVFAYFPEQEFFHMTDVIQICMENEVSVSAYVINEASFMDMGQMDELDKMQKTFR